MRGLTRKMIEDLANSPPDKFGVTHTELFYNEGEDKLYCVLDAPNEEAIWKHHESVGLKCEFVTEVRQVRTDRMVKTEKMRVLGEISSRVTHDLRNPLSIIRNSLDIISMKWKDDMDKDMATYVARMGRAVSTMNAIINDIVNYAKTRPLILGTHSFVSTLHSVLESVEVPRGVKITIPQEDISFEFDATKLELLFTNLITNSIHAIGNKEGIITIQVEEMVGDKVRIKMSDSGPGIPEELLPRIFEPLFTTKKHGTGLGLSSCKSVIEQHNGSISISNNPTTVTIILPRHHSSLSEISSASNSN